MIHLLQCTQFGGQHRGFMKAPVCVVRSWERDVRLSPDQECFAVHRTFSFALQYQLTNLFAG